MGEPPLAKREDLAPLRNWISENTLCLLSDISSWDPDGT
jgi:hypothetical protein